jgi:hypothetical protein
LNIWPVVEGLIFLLVGIFSNAGCIFKNIVDNLETAGSDNPSTASFSSERGF